MKSVALAPNTLHLQSGSNMGLIIHDGRAILIDAGLDDDAGRRALRILDEQDVSLMAVIITHAHADHFGGARYLQQRLDVPLYAPDLEAAIMEHPIIEPLYLFGGATPIAALRHKFTLAKPCRVDHTVTPGPLVIEPFQLDVIPLPGHALHQIGVGIKDREHRVLFCADAIFPKETIDKHRVLFCVDLDSTLETIRTLGDQPFDCFAPGHGPAYDAGVAIQEICDANRERLEEIREAVYEALKTPRETSAVVQHVAERFALSIAGPTAYFLTRATVLAALSSLEHGGRAEAGMYANKLMWERS